MSARALVLTLGDDKKQKCELKDVPLSEFPDGDVVVDVEASTVNYKDGLAVSGAGKVVRKFPMVPGIDMAGTVRESQCPDFKPGDRVLLNGYGASETLWGGYSTVWRGSGAHLVPVPDNLSVAQTMAIGTGGYTAMLCVLALERGGVTPSKGNVLVTGACGGVGTVAIALLSKLGYRVTALTGRTSEKAFLESLGASEIISREQLQGKSGPLGKERFAGVIDSVGGQVLANAIAQTKYLGVVAACGLAGGSDLPTTVLPFILRGVTLVGIDSVQAPKEMRCAAWKRLSTDLDVAKLKLITESNEIKLSDVPAAADRILAGTVRGRMVVNMSKL